MIASSWVAAAFVQSSVTAFRDRSRSPVEYHIKIIEPNGSARALGPPSLFALARRRPFSRGWNSSRT
jgi:hypothetical protein